MSQSNYQVSPFRPGESSCPDCSSDVEILQPKDWNIDKRSPSFFICPCGYIGQVGVGIVRHGKKLEQASS